MRIALKNCGWEATGDSVIIVCDPSRMIEVADPTGAVQTLLSALAEGPANRDELVRRLGVAGVIVEPDALDPALDVLDDLRLLVDADRHVGVDHDGTGRDVSNLAFFDLFASRDVTDREFLRRIQDAHVVQLGVGGLGSNAMQSLAGLGVGKLTLLDQDVVEPKNMARQFVYTEADFGSSKVQRAADWVRRFHSGIDVTAVHRWVGGPDDIADLLTDADLVVSGVDQPNDIDRWVNEACMTAGVPWIRGGMTGSRLLYFSVDPGRSACHACRAVALAGSGGPADWLTPHEVVADRAGATLRRVNRACGPAAALIGSLVAFEAARYLARFEEPYAAGAEVSVDTANGCVQSRAEWPADADCSLCAKAGRFVLAGATP